MLFEQTYGDSFEKEKFIVVSKQKQKLNMKA